MDIKIVHSMLLEQLETRASAEKIAEAMSLCGASVEKLQKSGKDWIYDIEVTTNRVDLMSVRGIAREAAAILPRFGIRARLKPQTLKPNSKLNGGVKFVIKTSPKLTRRVAGIVLGEVTKRKTPKWMAERLEMAGMRSLNAMVDITNYVMLELGQPMHVFDYDLIRNQKFLIRESKAGEKVVSLDGKEYKLMGGDIVIDDGSGAIIDLPGIIGTKNSVVNNNTKRVILFTENNNAAKIRQTSMGLAIRTMAATINEKSPDPELITTAISRGIELFDEICGAKPISALKDVYYNPYREKIIKIEHGLIEEILGIKLDKRVITESLVALGFGIKAKGKYYVLAIPSHRASDIEIPEDIAEEVARIYGYHNLPNRMLEGELPEKPLENVFDFELTVKRELVGLRAIEVYTSSMTGEKTQQDMVEIDNPLGEETRYLRRSLKTALMRVVEENKGYEEKAHVFEIANEYLPINGDLPVEKQMLSGIISGEDYRVAKGKVETLLERLNIEAGFEEKEDENFKWGRVSSVIAGGDEIGLIGIAENEMVYYEFEVELLRKHYKKYGQYQAAAKYPAQIEDLTFVLPDRTRSAEVAGEMKKASKMVDKVELNDRYKRAYTFRVWYLDRQKTLSNKEVEKIRKRLIERVGKKFGGVVRD